MAANTGESAADQDFAIWLDDYGINGVVGIWIEGGIEGAVGKHASDPIAGLAAKSGELSGGDDLSVGLKRNHHDMGISARVEGIESGVGIEPSDIVARLAIDAG